MPRNRGSVVDTRARTVRDRNGVTYPLDALAVSAHGLYHARPLDQNEHFYYHERWVLPGPGWLINRFAFHDHRTDKIDWYIETDLIEIDGDRWIVQDGYLDILIDEGVRYQVEDADELAEGMAAGEISIDHAMAALHAFDRLCRALRDNGCSGFALLAEYAPGLPAPTITCREDGMFRLAQVPNVGTSH